MNNNTTTHQIEVSLCDACGIGVETLCDDNCDFGCSLDALGDTEPTGRKVSGYGECWICGAIEVDPQIFTTELRD